MPNSIRWFSFIIVVFIVLLMVDKCTIFSNDSRVAQEHHVLHEVMCSTFKSTWEDFECETDLNHREPMIPVVELFKKEFRFHPPVGYDGPRHYRSLTGRNRLIGYTILTRSEDGRIMTDGRIGVNFRITGKHFIVTKVSAHESEFSRVNWIPNPPYVYDSTVKPDETAGE